MYNLLTMYQRYKTPTIYDYAFIQHHVPISSYQDDDISPNDSASQISENDTFIPQITNVNMNVSDTHSLLTLYNVHVHNLLNENTKKECEKIKKKNKKCDDEYVVKFGFQFKLFTKMKISCPVCLNTKNPSYMFKCRHAFCIDCTKVFLENELARNKNIIHCPYCFQQVISVLP